MIDDFDSVPRPWSIESEQSVLGALMLDPTAALRIVDRQLEPGHFYDSRHAMIWSAMAYMLARNLPLDSITVFERLQATQQDDAAGGLEYLNALALSVPNAANVGRYADVVLEKALRRAIVDAAGQAQVIAQEPGDADEALDKVASLFAALKRSKARAAPRPLSDVMAQRMEQWQALADGTIEPGALTGFDALDSALVGGIKPGKVVVLAARPSVGKTSLAGQIAINIAQGGRGVLVLSQEMVAGDLADRLTANIAGVPLDRFTAGRFEDGDWGRVAEAADAMSPLPIFIDDRPALTLLDIRAKVRQVQQSNPALQLVIVDYLQLCATSGGSTQHRHHQIEAISRGLKTLSKEANICVLLLSQLNRASEGDEPELHHLKESGAIEEDADTVLLLHPWSRSPDGLVTVLLKIPKNRQGRKGRLALSFDAPLQRWYTSSASVARSPK